MLLGELVRIEKSVISDHHKACGNNKQRYRPDFRQAGPGEYTSMYPLTKDTTLICMFVDLESDTGVFYIPSEEPLLRKYPKRLVEDSFACIHTGCPTSVVGRIIDISMLPADARAAYLYLSSVRLSLSGISGRMGPRGNDMISRIYAAEAYGHVRVRKLATDETMEGAIPEMMAQHRLCQATILSTGAVRTRGIIGGSFRSSFGNILEDLFSQMGSVPQPAPSGSVRARSRTLNSDAFRFPPDPRRAERSVEEVSTERSVEEVNTERLERPSRAAESDLHNTGWTTPDSLYSVIRDGAISDGAVSDRVVRADPGNYEVAPPIATARLEEAFGPEIASEPPVEAEPIVDEDVDIDDIDEDEDEEY